MYRPAEVDLLVGDSSKARAALGWAPTCSFEQLIKEMVWGDLESPPGGGGARPVW